MVKKLTFLLAASLAAPLPAACSNAHGTGTDDGGIVLPDSARTPDGHVGDASSTSSIGAACMMDTDCRGTNAMCFNDPNFVDDFPGGYCTAACDAAVATSCPAGSQCQQLGRTLSLCLATCDPASTTRQCGGRMGYGCSSNPRFAGFCIIGCFDATDCPTGLMCNRMGGQVGAGACYTPGATIGGACTVDTQCPIGGACLPEDGGGWPGGACIAPGCDAMANTGCTGRAQCIALTAGFGAPHGYCLQGCTVSSDCRVGYTCTPSPINPDRRYCAPGCTNSSQCGGGRVCNVGLGTCNVAFSGTIGGMCSFRDPMSCTGGTCLSERTAGFPAAMCTYAGCSATQPCPGGNVCAPRPLQATTNICLHACSSDTECRGGYHCRHANPADATSAMACVPSCTTSADCVNMGDVCNVGTGLCAQPFMASALGPACTTDATCAGGHCMTEAISGYSGGMCVYPGCSLTGTGGSPCPAMSACIDDHYGDPTIGVCTPTCTGATPCRAGYACVAIGTSGTSACQPMCTTRSCATGRTCNTMTGLCR